MIMSHSPGIRPHEKPPNKLLSMSFRATTIITLAVIFITLRSPALAGLPILIPQPQRIVANESPALQLAESGRATFRWDSAGKEPQIEEARKLILAQLAIADHEPSASRVLRLAVANQADALSPEESAALARSPQAYVIRLRADGGLDLLGASPIGVFYAASTLVQLIVKEGEFMTMPAVAVMDWPDIERREASEWLIQWWELNSYDWGDGPEKFIERCKRKIDLYARHKVNIIGFVSGKFRPHFPDAWDRIRKVAPELNDYAARKGVALQHTLTCYGGTIHDWGITDTGNYWLTPRESYPDGRELEPGEATVYTLGHEPMNQQVRNDITTVVRELRPRSLYLHWADAVGRNTQAIWRKRGSIDRAAFPDDDIYSPRGMAGAVAKMYSELIREIHKVRVPEHGFDAARDVWITIAGPNYGKASMPSEEWEQDTIRFWSAVAPLMTARNNTTLCIREVYLHDKTHELMPGRIAAAVATAGWPDAISMMALIGGGFDFSDRLFTSTPIFTNINRGATEFWTFNGHVNQEVLVLANANYSWNLAADGAADLSGYRGPGLYAEVKEYALGNKHSDYLYCKWMDRAAELAYGPAAGPHMAALLRLERDIGPLATSIAQLDKFLAHDSMRHLERHDFKAQAGRARQAAEHARRALAAAGDEGIKEDMAWLVRCLEVSVRMCDFHDSVFNDILSKTDASKTGIESATARLANLTGGFREWLKANFTFEKVDPFGGEPVMWLRMIDRIEARALNDLNARATNASLAGLEGVAVSATSEMKGYAALSALTSDPTGKGWGKNGGWNSAKRHGPPETLVITFAEPRLLGEVDVFALADDWKRLGEVTRDTPAGELACRSFEVEIRDADDGNWIFHHSVKDSERVWMSIPSPGRPVTGIRLTVTPNRHGYVSIVHVNLNGKFPSGSKPAAQ